ncbi:MAG: glycosyltransferase family 4 protein [Verrucomicrobiota bacterium]
MRLMKIALIRRRFSPTGGAERYLERLAEELQKQNVQVELWCENWNNPTSSIKNIRTVHSRNPWEFSEKIQQLKKEVDLRFALDRVPGVEVYRAGDGLHCSWLKNRELYSPFLGKIQNSIRFKNRTMLQLDQAIYTHPDLKLVIANSAMVAKEIEETYHFPSQKIAIVHNGIPTHQFQNGDRTVGRRIMYTSPQDYVILLVGAGKERKGHRFLKEAHSKMSHEARLWIIDYPPSTPIQNIYAGADLFVLPTLYDPFSNVILEALTAGKPVITTRHNGAHEVIQTGVHGWILDRANDVDRLRQHLDALADPEIRRPFAEAARQLGSQFTIEKNVRETLQALNSI